MADFSLVDLGNSPYYGTSYGPEGDLISGGNAGYFDFNDPSLELGDISSFYSPGDVGPDPGFSAKIDPTKLQSFLGQRNLGLKSYDVPGTSTRGLFDLTSGTQRGNLQQAGNDDTDYWLAAMMMAAPVLGAVGAGAMTQGAVAGAGGAAASGDMSLSNMARGAATGAATGYASTYTPNYAGYAGVTNPVAEGAINSSVNSGISTGLRGGEVREAMGRGAITGGLNAMSDPTFDELPGTMGGTMQDGYGESSVTMGGSPTTTQYAANTQANTADQSIALPVGDENTARPFSAQIGDLVSGIAGALGNGKVGNLQYGDLAQGLMGLYGGYQQRKQAKDLRDIISGRRGAYETNMRNNIAGKMRAGGKRSNISGREMQVQAALADLDSRNAPMFASLNNQEFAGLANMLQSGNMMLNRGGFYGAPRQAQQTPTLQTMNTTPMSIDYSLQPKQKNPFSLGG